MENTNASEKIHRVGTFTLGISLILFGLLYFLRIFIPAIPAAAVFRLWPLMMILLGIEVLLSCAGKKQFQIDKVSVILLVLLIFFIGCMACIETAANWFLPRI